MKLFEGPSSANILGCFELIQNQERHKGCRERAVLTLFYISLLSLSKAFPMMIFQEVIVD